MKDRRQAVRLSAIAMNNNGKKYLSIEQVAMKDLKRGDLFILLENTLELVTDKQNRFLYRATSDGIPHKDTYVIKAEEI